ncbi:hypothetical protein CAEBREN_19856 [Caenorhabditis brenneri]|uniref:DUF7592 domain-containing protein n=1 Tax=Caenorhabditis brenneri TaxID=135651 RepID=G0PL58_CAEBE|nr:hypothetical protein CAEBREN_19856 [Caenorhabditis brenneri]
MPHVENVTLNAWQTAYGSSSHISLLAFPADPKNTYSLRSVMVFTGIDTTSSYVNNLYELHKKQHQWISQSNGCFVINVEARGVLDKLLVQSTQDLEGIKPYNELNCKPNSICTKKLNGKPGQVSGFVSIDPQTHTLTDIQMDSTFNLLETGDFSHSQYVISRTPSPFFVQYYGFQYANLLLHLEPHFGYLHISLYSNCSNQPISRKTNEYTGKLYNVSYNPNVSVQKLSYLVCFVHSNQRKAN